MEQSPSLEADNHQEIAPLLGTERAISSSEVSAACLIEEVYMYTCAEKVL
jgi:hypothetical protein